MTDAAIPGGRLGSVSEWCAWLFGPLADRLVAEGDRRLLWLPVFFGAGIGAYFTLTVEPPLWPSIAAAIAGLVLVFALRRHPALCEMALALTALAAGFALMRETAREHQAPMLQRHLGPIAVTGRVVDIDDMEKGWRVIIDVDPLPGLDASDQPRRVRVHIPPKSDELNPGDRVSLKAMLYPVPAQVLPGGRDLQRELYFSGIGGVGYNLGPARRITEPEAAGRGSSEAEGGWREALRRLRTEMSRRIVAVLPGSTGGVASALITGKRGAITEEVKQDFRDSGLSHLLSIAGLHLGLVGAFVFFVVRGGLALIPPIALRYPIKKIAAGAALVVLTCYLLISGAAIPTERAFVMNGIFFVAIIIDRLRISMRVCALAALVVLVMDPASLVGVSFQMSFGAVVALIAVYETYGRQLGRLLHNRSIVGQVVGYCGGVVVTTVVATLGTCAFSIYHFHNLALYSSLANVIAVPLSAMWTLPFGVVSCLLMPFGLERLGLVPMGWGIDTTIWVAHHVSALPGDVWAMPRLPPTGLLLISLGGLWLCLWRGDWRRWGMVAIIAGFAGMMAIISSPQTRARRSRDRCLPRRPARRWRPGPQPEAGRRAGSTAPESYAATPRAAGRSRSSPDWRRCRSKNAAGSTRSSAKCLPVSAVAPLCRSSTASTRGGAARSHCGSIKTALSSRARTRAGATGPGSRIRGRSSRRRCPRKSPHAVEAELTYLRSTPRGRTKMTD
jgi:competence protein ComEC